MFSEISSVTSSQESLLMKMKEQRELRKKDEELHTKEQKRLDEIVHMFEEYRVRRNLINFFLIIKLIPEKFRIFYFHDYYLIVER